MKRISMYFITTFIVITCLYSQQPAKQSYDLAYNQKNAKKFDGQGRPLYYKDRIYLKVKKYVKVTPLKRDKTQNEFTKLGISSIDEILNKYLSEKIEPAFRTGKVLSEKLRNRIQNKLSVLPDLTRIYSVKVPDAVNSNALINDLNNDPNIEYAEFIPIDYPCAVPNDSMYAEMQHLPQIHAEEAWDIFKGEDSDSTIIIGICDTGVNWNHSDLNDNLFQNLAEDADHDGKVIEWIDSLGKFLLDSGDINGIDDDGNGYIDDMIGWDFLDDYDKDNQGNDPMDYHNHGTHVAGISAGVTDNANGIASISWNVKFMPTSHSSPTFQNIIRGFEGIVYLAEMGCDVINCSWGGGGYSKANAESVEYASGLGALIVVAAGNNDSPADFYPSAYPNLVSIASVNVKDIKAGYSNYGKCVDLSAPGGETGNPDDRGILSTVKNGFYDRYNGTSMASPVAAGVFGLVKAYHPDWSNQQIIMQVVGTADFIDTLNTNYLNMLGSGRVNAYRALTETNVTIPKSLKLSIMSVNPDDSTGNNNKALEPGETIRIGLLMRNYSILSGSGNTKLKISTTDPDIEILQDSTFVKFSPDAFTVVPSDFLIKISDKAVSKFVKFTVTAESEDAEILLGKTNDFEIPINAGGILVWEGANARGYSGTFIKDFLIGQGINVLYSNTFPVSMVGFDAVFLSFGSIGSGLNSVGIDDWMAQDIQDYLMSGGKLYLETMDGLGWDQKDNHNLLSLLGIDSSSDGSSNPRTFDSLFGMNNSIMDSLIYWRSNISNYSSVDELFPDSNAKVALYEPLYGNSAIQNIGEFGQKTFVMVYPVNNLIDRNHPNTRYEFIKRIMDFLDIPMDYTIPRFSYNPGTGHAPLTVRFYDISYTSIEAIGWEWDFQNDGKTDLEVNNPEFTFNDPGDYVSKMTVSNGLTNQSTTNPVYVFDGESSAYFNYSGRASILDTNMNITGAFTLEAWIYPNSLGQTNLGRIIDKNQFGIMLNSANQFKLIVENDSGSTDLITSDNSVTFNTWQHIAVTYDGDSTYLFYINGLPAESSAFRGPFGGKIKDNSKDALTVGNRFSSGRAFDGRIDEVRIWEKARTLNEIQSSIFRKLSGNEAGLLVYWQFNEGNGIIAADKSVNKRDGAQNAGWRQGVHEGHIMEQAKSLTVCEQSSAKFSVNIVSGMDSLTFRWFKDDSPVENSNSSDLVFEIVKPEDEGAYYLEVTNFNTFDIEKSEEVFLAVNELLEITKQPLPKQKIEIGKPLLLSIEAVSNTNLKYEWFKDSVTTGNNKPDFSIESVAFTDAGSYYCKINNDCGTVYSDTISVSVVTDVVGYGIENLWLDIVPNPVTNNSKVILNVPNISRVKISLVDILGKTIVSHEKNTFKGILNINLFTGLNLNSGIYYVTVECGVSTISKPIIVIK